MSNITIGNAAKILGVNKKTLMRWDKSRLFPATREPVSNIRVYNQDQVENVLHWLALRKKHRAHLQKLVPIRQSLDRFITKQPFPLSGRPKLYKLEEAKKAFNDLHNWENELKKIYKEYAGFNEYDYGKLEDDMQGKKP